MKKTIAEIVTNDYVLNIEIIGTSEPNQKFYQLAPTLMGEARRYNAELDCIEVWSDTLNDYDHYEDALAFQIINKEV